MTKEKENALWVISFYLCSIITIWVYTSWQVSFAVFMAIAAHEMSKHGGSL